MAGGGGYEEFFCGELLCFGVEKVVDLGLGMKTLRSGLVRCFEILRDLSWRWDLGFVGFVVCK